MKTRWSFFLCVCLMVGGFFLLASCGNFTNAPIVIRETPVLPHAGTPMPVGVTPQAGMVEVVLKSAADSPSLAYFTVYDQSGKQIFQSDSAPALSYKLYVPIGVYKWVAQIPIPTKPLKCYVVPSDYGFSKEGSFTAQKDPVTIEVKLGQVLVPCTATPTITPTYPCPQATQELPPRVAPVTSPTNELSQVIVVRPGNYELATVDTESGTYTAPFNGADGARVTVNLLPNAANHLKVTVRVRKSTYQGCTYGGYDMTVYNDENGQPLVIVQGTPVTPLPVTEAFGPQTLERVKQLAVVSFSGGQRPWDVAFSQPDILASFGFGQGVQYWQLPGGQTAGDRMLNNQGMTSAAAFSADGTWMATGSAGWDNNDENQTSVRLWNLTTGQVRLLGHHPSSVESLAFNPSGTLLASGGNDNTVIIWNVASGGQVATLKGDVATLNDGTKLIQGMRQLFWDGDAKIIARGDAVIYEWSVPPGQRLREIGGEYKDLSFDSTTGRMAVVRDDGVYLIEANGSPQMLMLGTAQTSQGYQQVALSPDGKTVAALNATTVTFWDTDTRQVIGSGKNPAGAVVVFSPDWRYLARVNWDEFYVSVWGVQP